MMIYLDTMYLDIKRHCGYSLDGEEDITARVRCKEEAMNKMIFVNLPVRDLPASTAFYIALGGELNPQFSGDKPRPRSCFRTLSE